MKGGGLGDRKLSQTKWQDQFYTFHVKIVPKDRLRIDPRSTDDLWGTVEPPLTATSLQRPLFLVPADSLYIHSYSNLYNGHLSITATATKARPNCQNNL